MTGGYYGKNIQLNTDIHAVTVPETLPSYIMSLPTYGEDIEHLFVGEEVQSTPMDWEFAHADFGKEYSDGSQLMCFSGDFMWQKDPENDNGLYGVAVTGKKTCRIGDAFFGLCQPGRCGKSDHKYCGTDDFF